MDLVLLQILNPKFQGILTCLYFKVSKVPVMAEYNSCRTPDLEPVAVHLINGDINPRQFLETLFLVHSFFYGFRGAGGCTHHWKW